MELPNDRVNASVKRKYAEMTRKVLTRCHVVFLLGTNKVTEKVHEGHKRIKQSFWNTYQMEDQGYEITIARGDNLGAKPNKKNINKYPFSNKRNPQS